MKYSISELNSLIVGEDILKLNETIINNLINVGYNKETQITPYILNINPNGEITNEVNLALLGFLMDDIQEQIVSSFIAPKEETIQNAPSENQIQLEGTLKTEETNNIIATNSSIADIQQQIDILTKELLLKKSNLETDGPYLNDSYLKCPSFYNLIEPIKNAIINKRNMSINKFWYEKYRPELVEEILFPNKAIKETITEYVRKDFIGGHCLFYGEGGVGKTTTNQVLMNAILKNAADKFILDRKVESVDALKGFLNKKAIGRQKIIIAEEIDRLSDSAMTELKNGLLEKYEDSIFLASTNKIHKIDSALLTRFTLVAKFDTVEIEELVHKCESILINERIVYKKEDIITFVENNKLKGIRTLINNLQLSCYDRVFDANRTSYFIGSSGTEFNLIQWVKYYISCLVQYDLNSLYSMMFTMDYFPDLKKIRDGIMETVLYNYNLNYDYVFMDLLKDSTIFLPVKITMENYYQEMEFKKIKSMHFEAMLNDITKAIYEFKNVELNWQHKQYQDQLKQPYVQINQ